MFKADVEAVVNAAVGKKEQMNHNSRYMVSAMLAGAYVGIGIVLIFKLGRRSRCRFALPIPRHGSGIRDRAHVGGVRRIRAVYRESYVLR